MSTGPWEGGKGSRPRKYSVSKYQDNYERIFNAARKGKEQGSDQPQHHERDSGGSPKGSGSGDSVQQGG